MPVLSVIVPFYNVEKYIGPCLDSIAAQTLADLEVICVDDGSADGGPDLVLARQADDPRISLVRQPNHGVGRARNVGVSRAGGRYLAFVDGDDTVPRDAFRRLVSSLESSGSDLACGNVMRLHNNLLVPSWAHRQAFARPIVATHITRHPLLIRDRMLWNKVYRRSFWDGLGLSFPERMYEDQPVAMAAHVGARAVDVLARVVYHWRQRDEPGTSITQRCLEPGNLRDRLLSVLETSALLEKGAPRLKPDFDRDTLDIDMAVAVEAVAAMGPAADPGLIDLIVRYLDGVSREAWQSIPFEHRLQVHLLHRRRLDELADAFRQARDGRLQPRVSATGVLRRRWYGRHPWLPSDLSEVSDELGVAARLVSLDWRDGVLTGVGRVAVGRFDVGELRRLRVRVWMRERKTGEIVRLSAAETRPTWESVEREGGAPVAEHAFPFRFAFDPAMLSAAQLARRGHWDLYVQLRGRGLKLDGRVAGPRWSPPLIPAPRRRAGVWLVPVRNFRGVWGLRLRTAQAVIGECRVDDGDLVFSGEISDVGDGDPVLRLRRRSDGEEMYFPVALAGQDFHARVPLADIDESVGTVSCWEVVIDQGKPIRPLVRTRQRPVATVADRRFLVDRAEDGCLLVAERLPGDGAKRLPGVRRRR
ncbi:glycosyltransferase family 2 protein [Nonomuraea jiangxiensis]|uniref:CDP-glycerol glycerophosphotransferase n=1 Tax=Nonomuraea jiangxiensis TaxID=633440 RepID=A0A1G8G037_9ACTN|nr:glycosyltransferase family 2 protein [Nonomuraea jiangxiensis]SDH87769.1 CDP-glycerol glycerophosphotransferase [Nonomuraea jiangxiensis]